jgi:hypothetical protein
MIFQGAGGDRWAGGAKSEKEGEIEGTRPPLPSPINLQRSCSQTSDDIAWQALDQYEDSLMCNALDAIEDSLIRNAQDAIEDSFMCDALDVIEERYCKRS